MTIEERFSAFRADVDALQVRYGIEIIAKVQVDEPTFSASGGLVTQTTRAVLEARPVANWQAPTETEA